MKPAQDTDEVDVMPKPLRTQFGRWTLNVTTVCLEIPIPPEPSDEIYQVPLERMTDSARILDWIFQLEEKTWVSPGDLGHLVEALAHIFGRGVCGGGMDRPINAEAKLRRFGCNL
jgi:hypothetical protein